VLYTHLDKVAGRVRDSLLCCGTLQNGLVYVAVTRGQSNGKLTLGLFAGQDIPAQTVVTLYGGSLTQSVHVDVNGCNDVSHGRMITHHSHAGWMLTGFAWSQCFRHVHVTRAWMRAQCRLKPASRVHILPMDHPTQSISSHLISTTGIGYMANTGLLRNVRSDCFNVPLTVNGGLPIMVLITNKFVRAHTEIISPYRKARCVYSSASDDSMSDES
jgi:hypothetical protein